MMNKEKETSVPPIADKKKARKKQVMMIAAVMASDPGTTSGLATNRLERNQRRFEHAS